MAGRISWLCATVLAASCALPAGAVELRGFRGYAWGTGVDSLGDVQHLSSDGDLQCRRREAMRIWSDEYAPRAMRVGAAPRH